MDALTIKKYIMTIIYFVSFLTLSACSGANLFVVFEGSGSLGSGGNVNVNEIEKKELALLGKLDDSCFANAEYDACIFHKDPVSQGKSALGAPLSFSSDLSGLQKYGVKIRGLDGSGFLQNSTLAVHPAEGDRAVAVGSSWKLTYAEDSVEEQYVGQVMAYYWANFLKEVMEVRTGEFHAKDKNVQVFVGDEAAGWSSVNNSIHLETSDTENQMALDGGLAAHFMGLANLHHANSGEINNLTGDTKHATCGEGSGVIYEKGCCTTKIGCSKALSIGIADYHAALLFAEAPTVGEVWVNDVAGLDSCGQSRDFDQNSTRTVLQAYDVCTSDDRSGDVYALGTVYGSIWWEIRKKAEKLEKYELDQLFSKHLTKLDGQDDFITALVAIKLVDQELFSGKYSSRFDDEYTKRGL